MKKPMTMIYFSEAQGEINSEENIAARKAKYVAEAAEKKAAA
jgi:hypothetical protein